MELASDIPPLLGDRVQIQQVILNLLMNGIEAVASLTERPRELSISTRNYEAGKVLVTVRDSGLGVDPGSFVKIVGAFYTPKAQGMGMRLALTRSVAADHCGQTVARDERRSG